MRKSKLPLILIGCAIAAVVLVAAHSLINRGEVWRVTDDGFLEYSASSLKYDLRQLEASNDSTLYETTFSSRGFEIKGLLRIPENASGKAAPGVVLLPGATVTKEREQVLAEHLAALGFASLALDQRNLGATDIQGDLSKYLKGEEPTEHMMVHDALAAAEVLKRQPGIDPTHIVYAGESNGARFAIIACALDPDARGVVAISTCGYGTADAFAQGLLRDPNLLRFYMSIDPETYFSKIAPRKLVMIHSRNDTVVPYELALQTFTKASDPKELHTVGCAKHGYCTEMNAFLDEEIKGMVS
jgi:dienelactone hydrolase